MPGEADSRDPYEPDHVVERVGVDTVSFAWRPEDDPLWSRLGLSVECGAINGTRKVVPSGAPSVSMLADPLGGARWFISPEWELIYCEGRLSAMLSEDLSVSGLASFDELARAARHLSLAFGDLVDRSLGLGENPNVRRLDLAADLRFLDPLDGITAMSLLSEITLPRIKTSRWSNEGRVETLSYHAATKKKSLLHRIYDKGVEVGTDRPGSLLRFERQHRWSKKEQQSVESLMQNELPGDLWLAGFEAWAGTVERSVSGKQDAAQRALISMIEAGEVEREKGERLLGSLTIAQICGEGWWKGQAKPHLGRRRRAELQALGLSLGPRQADQRQLSMSGPMRSLRQAWLPEATEQSSEATSERLARTNGAEQAPEGAEEEPSDG